MAKYVGVDIGGTNLRVCQMDDDETLEYINTSDYSHDNAYDLLTHVANMIERVPDFDKTSGIGISIAGSVDNISKKVVTSKNLSYLVNYPIVDTFYKIYNKPVCMENDAKLAAYGEALKGAGQKYDKVCYVTISTGLGGGLILDKKIYQGANNLGGYISRFYLDGEHTADDILSGRVLLMKARERIDNNIDSNKDLFELYSMGNPEAINIINDFKHYLVILLLNITAAYNPDIIILGGGLMKSKELFLKDVVTDYYHKVHPLAKHTIVTTKGLEEPGLVGACLLNKSRRLTR